MFFPRIKFEVISSRAPEEIRARLQSVTKTRENDLFFHVFSEGWEFMGKVGERDFKLLPILRKDSLPGFLYPTLRVKGFQVKDSFLPVIVGQMRRTGRGTAVDIKMRLSWPVILFLIVWFGGVGFAFLASLLAVLTGDGLGMAAGTGGMLLAGQLLVRIGFYLPAKMARQKLETLFKM